MKLISLKLRNFKGIKEFELKPGGESQAIFGDNGTGKTTLFDAFSYLLFDKDSANRKDFEIKTLGPDGEPIHGLEHEVEAVLGINGCVVTLRKVYSESWTKKRGSVDRQFTGHTTDYFIDGVPTKKNEYEGRMVTSIIDEEAFKLLTNPRHFNEVLHWQDRRKLLLEVCGDLTDAEVIATDPKLAKLPEVLNGRRLDDHRKVIAARRAVINKEIETIPVRISEVQRGLPDAGDATKLTKGIEDFRGERNVKAQELANLEAGGGVAEKTKELRLVEAEIIKVEQEHSTMIASLAQAAGVEVIKSEQEWMKASSIMASRKEQIEARQASIEQYEAKLDDLRRDWSTANSKTFTIEAPATCPVCGQALLPGYVEAVKERATATFNQNKASELAAITAEGQSLKARLGDLNEEVTKLEQENANDQERLAALAQEIATAQGANIALESKGPELPSGPAYVELTQKKTDIEAEIEMLKGSNTDAVEALERTLTRLDIGIADLESMLAQAMQREAGMERIEELKTEERTLAKEFEKLEAELYLTDEFVRTKVTLLEDRINSRFTMARFKLFNQLVNGGIEEVCETIYLGVPYSSALNNSARINIGLDIINTLGGHFQFVAPIWIDNAEAVTELLATKGQQIRLYVSEADKVLRIEPAYVKVVIK